MLNIVGLFLVFMILKVGLFVGCEEIKFFINEWENVVCCILFNFDGKFIIVIN